MEPNSEKITTEMNGMTGSQGIRMTQLLLDWSAGDEQALEKLTPIVYKELYRLAKHYMRLERQGHVLQVTALVNLRANIPFPFMVNEVEFTPGIYTAQLTSSRQVLEIRSEDGKKAAFVLLLAAHSNRAQHHGLFVFSGYGSQYFLSKVSWPDYGTDCEVLKSEREKDIARRVESQSVSISPINR